MPDSLVKFFETFYQISDTPDAHEKYADYFTKDGVMVLASAKVEGREGWSRVLLLYDSHSTMSSLSSKIAIENSMHQQHLLYTQTPLPQPGLLSLRQKMWSAVSSRSHYPTKIFPFKGGASSTSAEREVMIYGTVSYGLKAGGSDEKEWAARAVLVRDGRGLRKGGMRGCMGGG